jgi:hypothetical protein
VGQTQRLRDPPNERHFGPHNIPHLCGLREAGSRTSGGAKPRGLTTGLNMATVGMPRAGRSQEDCGDDGPTPSIGECGW